MTSGEAIAPGAAALAEAKAYMRVDGADEDAAIGGLIASAVAVCEDFVGRAVLARGFAEALPASAAWTRLARTPVREIIAVTDESGGAVAVDAHAVDIDEHGDGWVRFAGAGRPRVVYRAGLVEDWAALPEALRHGIVRLAAHLHSERGGDAPPPAAVTALWRPFRRMRLR